DLLDGPRGLDRSLLRQVGRVLEVLEEGPVETVEGGEVTLVRELLPLAGPSAQHLREEDARLHHAQEDDELEVRDVDAGRQEIHRDGDSGLGAVAELPDALER